MHCPERIVYRKFLPSGLTAFDPVDEITLGHQLSQLHVAVQREADDLYARLKLPLNDRARRRAAVRAEWFASANIPLDTYGVLVD
jgi:chromosome partitioning protein